VPAGSGPTPPPPPPSPPRKGLLAAAVRAAGLLGRAPAPSQAPEPATAAASAAANSAATVAADSAAAAADSAEAAAAEDAARAARADADFAVALAAEAARGAAPLPAPTPPLPGSRAHAALFGPARGAPRRGAHARIGGGGGGGGAGGSNACAGAGAAGVAAAAVASPRAAAPPAPSAARMATARLHTPLLVAWARSGGGGSGGSGGGGGGVGAASAAAGPASDGARRAARCRALLRLGADGALALEQLVRERDARGARRLLAAGVSAEGAGRRGRPSPLAITAQALDAPCVRALLRAGASARRRASGAEGARPRAPLALCCGAAADAAKGAAQRLREAAARRAQAQGHFGITSAASAGDELVAEAAAAGEARLEVARLLLDAGADADGADEKEDEDEGADRGVGNGAGAGSGAGAGAGAGAAVARGATPLCLARGAENTAATAAAAAASAGASVSAMFDSAGRSAAQEAEAAARLALARLLLRRGARADAPRPDGTSPLWFACAAGDAALAAELLAAGAPRSAAASFRGRSPLHALIESEAPFRGGAAGAAARAALEALLSAGADARAPNATGRGAADGAGRGAGRGAGPAIPHVANVVTRARMIGAAALHTWKHHLSLTPCSRGTSKAPAVASARADRRTRPHSAADRPAVPYELLASCSSANILGRSPPVAG